MLTDSHITIAIDGYSSCGKSTLAKALAKKLNYVFIDSGAMYRAVTFYCFQHGLVGPDTLETEKIIAALPEISIRFVMNTEAQKLEVELNGVNVEKEIRTLQISQLVSKISAIKEVRVKLVDEQRQIGKNGGVVMDGRDIGSVVFPNAELKLFVTADPMVRAERRFKELNDPTISLQDVLENLKQRDQMDSSRSESPLIQTEDAILIDNSNLTQEQQLQVVLNIIEKMYAKS